MNKPAVAKNQKPRKIPIPKLPDVPMLTILNCLPLDDLLTRIPLVCKRLYELQPTATLMRQCITLLVNDPERTIPCLVENVKDPNLAYLLPKKRFI